MCTSVLAGRMGLQDAQATDGQCRLDEAGRCSRTVPDAGRLPHAEGPLRRHALQGAVRAQGGRRGPVHPGVPGTHEPALAGLDRRLPGQGDVRLQAPGEPVRLPRHAGGVHGHDP